MGGVMLENERPVLGASVFSPLCSSFSRQYLKSLSLFISDLDRNYHFINESFLKMDRSAFEVTDEVTLHSLHRMSCYLNDLYRELSILKRFFYRLSLSSSNPK
ncbi:hypothetical protein KBP48_05690 [Xylella fastidiosa subsp. multiplex]|nr:hypothetical protein KBP48_05690 [Xylella fastidiosa subsp. multiplex]TNV95751.1 hypothetical protein C5H22_07460 [Xylella fastidiosa]TNV96250.1 hypothetical protein C5H22_07075 [Xylella fastidiosa]TNV96934.1 hypothetical protein C5H21_14200 [Xylella fastidiosa]TNV96950.1 hypothetical protein C5H21_14155 [Xylella fastidiosa]